VGERKQDGIVPIGPYNSGDSIYCLLWDGHTSSMTGAEQMFRHQEG
jgi:hypothetical protein